MTGVCRIAVCASFATGLSFGSALAEPPSATAPPASVSDPAAAQSSGAAGSGAAGQDATVAAQKSVGTNNATTGRTAENGSAVLPEVVVTAEKRSTSLQRTPIAITALSGQALERAQIRTLPDIAALVPNFKMSQTDGYSEITIRGIGISDFVPGAEGAVAVNFNEVYVSRPIAQLAGLYDVSSIEVLRGPQGTLYGRNATAGSVNVNTTLPTNRFSGYSRLTLGDYGDVNAEAAVGGPIISDKLLLRVAATEESRGGYGKNLDTGNGVDDRNAAAVRGTLVFIPVHDVKATLIAEYFREYDHSDSQHYFGAAGLTGLPGSIGVTTLPQQLGYNPPANVRDIAQADDPEFRLQTTAVTGILDWTHGPFGVKFVTGYRTQNAFTSTDANGFGPQLSQFIGGEPAHQFTEELQGHYDTQRLHVTTGAYYFTEHDDFSPGAFTLSTQALNIGYPQLPQRAGNYPVDFLQFGGLIETAAEAAFAQATYEIIDGLSLTAGVRYSSERKHLYQRFGVDLYTPYTAETQAPEETDIPAKKFQSTTPKFGAQYLLTPTTTVYATYAKGFKAGGFDTGAFPAAAYQPEKLTDYEGGIKTTALGGRFRSNIAGFYYDYTNLQVQQVVGATTITTNAASATIYGVEGEFTAVPINPLTLNFSISYLHARYGNYTGPDPALPLLSNVDFSGNKLNNSPDFSGHASAEYTWGAPHGTVALRGEADFTTSFFFSPDNIPLEGQGGFVKENAFLTYNNNDQNWHVTLFVRNLSDVTTKTSTLVNSAIIGNAVVGSLSPPRTFGAELGYRF